MSMEQRAVLLHDIRSTHNVGSIFRTAECAGVTEIVLSGYTPAPLDRFGRAQKDIAKTALGAEKTVRWSVITDPLAAISEMKARGLRIAGIEQDARAIDYRRYVEDAPTLYVLGNEVDGIPADLRAVCDVLLEIPMLGSKESLNVSVAAGVVLFATLRGQ
jgi:tRNA G18 (ribose-2'-O)-methylase SpoU